VVTADSTVSTLTGAIISETAVSNGVGYGAAVTHIVGNGHPIRCGSASPGLGKICTRPGGGALTPA